MKDELEFLSVENVLNLRTEIYYFLKSVFYKEPTNNLLDRIKSIFVSIQHDINSDIDKGLDILRRSINDVNLEDLRLEYNKLFVGPFKTLVPPFESVHRNKNGLVMQTETIQVRNAYRECGLCIKGLYHYPDDHMGAELEFMAYLGRKAYEGYKERKYSSCLFFLEKQKKFLDDHLGLWAIKFCGEVIRNTDLLYQGVAYIMKGFLNEEKENIPRLISKIKEASRCH